MESQIYFYKITYFYLMRLKNLVFSAAVILIKEKKIDKVEIILNWAFKYFHSLKSCNLRLMQNFLTFCSPRARVILHLVSSAKQQQHFYFRINQFSKELSSILLRWCSVRLILFRFESSHTSLRSSCCLAGENSRLLNNETELLKKVGAKLKGLL